MTAQTLTLADFLLARIAEDEAAAKETWPNDWIADGNNVTSRDPDPRESYLGDRTQVARLSMTVGKFQREAANAEHIARHDPARVLAECAAKRRIVEMTTYVLRHDRIPTDKRGVFDVVPVRQPYATDSEDILRALALPFADHPDFRTEWRA